MLADIECKRSMLSASFIAGMSTRGEFQSLHRIPWIASISGGNSTCLISSSAIPKSSRGEREPVTSTGLSTVAISIIERGAASNIPSVGMLEPGEWAEPLLDRMGEMGCISESPRLVAVDSGQRLDLHCPDVRKHRWLPMRGWECPFVHDRFRFDHPFRPLVSTGRGDWVGEIKTVEGGP